MQTKTKKATIHSKIGETESYLLNEMSKRGAIHLTLLDPESGTPSELAAHAHYAQSQGTSGIMIGGSTSFATEELDACVKAVKTRVRIPVILFPNNVSGISRYADAIFFMSLLNSVDPYFIVGAQSSGAMLVKKFGLEPIPMGYIVFGETSSVAAVGKALPLPMKHGEVAAALGLAAQYLGMRFIYLEAGSGAESCIPGELVEVVRRALSASIIVGGGIRRPEDATSLAHAGADAIVTGTIIEQNKQLLGRVIRALNSARAK